MLGAPASSLVTDSVKKKKKMAPGACQGLEGNFFFFFFFAWLGNRFVRGCPDPPQRLREAPRPHALTGRELSPSLVPCELYGFSLEMAIWSKVEESGKLLDPEENHTPSAEREFPVSASSLGCSPYSASPASPRPAEED